MVKKTDYDTKITEIENEIPDNINLTKKTDFNKKPGNISNRVTSSKKKKTGRSRKDTKWSSGASDHVTFFKRLINNLLFILKYQ